jgi:SAM-dependent methyltransferase
VALLDAQRAARFVEFDILKYDGLLSKWLDSVPPVVLRCRDCEHCWYRYQPVGEQLGLMYATGKTLNQDVNPTREAEPHMRREMRRLRKLVGNTSANPATLLDFGSGVGRWARAAVLENFSVTAYEPSVERGSENDTPFELVHSIGELENRKFDVIQLEQVLEHVPDPLSTLKQLREVCKPHTIMRISVPNLLRNQDGVKVWATWPFDGQAPHFLAPFEHLHGFTPSSLDRLLKRAGYRDISVKAEAESAVINLLRRIIGRIFPILNSTLRYVRPES